MRSVCVDRCATPTFASQRNSVSVVVAGGICLVGFVASPLSPCTYFANFGQRDGHYLGCINQAWPVPVEPTHAACLACVPLPSSVQLEGVTSCAGIYLS